MKKEEIRELIKPMGGCIASNDITIENHSIGYMYRENANFKHDSGWRFFSGTENQDYADDEKNFMIYDVNTIANYDPDIIPYLNLPVGTVLERVKNQNIFKEIKET